MNHDDTLERLRAYAAANPTDVKTVAYTVRDMAELEAYRALQALATCWRKKLPTSARRRVLLSYGVDMLQGKERGDAMLGLLEARRRQRERMTETLECALKRALRWNQHAGERRREAAREQPFLLVRRKATAPESCVRAKCTVVRRNAQG